MTYDLKSYFNNSRLTTICGSTASGKTAAVLQILKSLDNKTTNNLVITDEEERMFYLLKRSEYSYKYLFENNIRERLSHIEDNSFKAKSRILNKPMDNVGIINIYRINILEQLNNFMDQYDNIYIDSINCISNLNISEFLIEIRKILSHQHLNRKIFLTINTRRSSLDIINNIPIDFIEKSDVLINSTIKNKELCINFIKNKWNNAYTNIKIDIKDIYSSV